PWPLPSLHPARMPPSCPAWERLAAPERPPACRRAVKPPLTSPARPAGTSIRLMTKGVCDAWWTWAFTSWLMPAEPWCFTPRHAHPMDALLRCCDAIPMQPAMARRSGSAWTALPGYRFLAQRQAGSPLVANADMAWRNLRDAFHPVDCPARTRPAATCE